MRKWLVMLATMLLCLSTLTWAQDTANITGTVTDTTGAVIPNVKITVSNPDVGYTRETVSDTAGVYTVSRVPIGNYVVTAEAAGFQKLVRSGITLTVGQIQRVDLQMTVGQVTQEVTVTGNVPQVETETAAISDVVTGQQIANLELNGRNFVTLALLVPGAAPDNGLDTSHVGVYGNNSISFNGSRTQYNNWEIDGGNNTDEGSAGTFNVYPNLDTIAEFRISTSNYGADMGKHAGATIEVATKSGTRTFHGDVFEYNRNNTLAAVPWDINRSVLNGDHPTRPKLNWNDYGYTLGGPFYIPGVYNTDKSKTFFYWSEDWRKYVEGQTIGSGVASVRQRNGDFSECPGGPNFNPLVACDSGSITDAIVNNGWVISPTMAGWDPVNSPIAFANAQELLNGLVPYPNSGPSGYRISSSTSTNWRQEQIRVDQNVSDKTTVFVRYTHDAWNTLAVPALWSWSSLDTIKTPFDGPGTTAVLHITHSFKPNLMNEFIMGWTQDHILLYNQAGTDCGPGLNQTCAINRSSNFQLAHFFPANSGNKLLPSIEVCGGGPCFDEDASNHPWFNSNPIVTWKDNVAWTHGPHTLRFGVFIENYRKNEQFGANTQGFIYFDNWGSNTSGNSMADMFLGLLEHYDEGTQTSNGVPVGGYPKGHWRMGDYEPYIQDDWKVNSHLTLNIGLRYYYLTRIHDMSNPTVDSGFLPQLYNPANEARYDSNGELIQGTGALYTNFGNGLVECGHNGIPLGCQLTNSGANWAPRFGFAWDPWGNGKTVIRGGYGIYYEMGNGNEAQAEGGEGNPPVALDPTAVNLGALGTPNVSGYGLVQPVFVNGAYSSAIGLPPTTYTAWPYSQPWGSEQQFSLGVQHQFSGSNIMSVGYVGMQGRHLARNRNLTQPYVGLPTNWQGANVPYVFDVSKTVLIPQLAGSGPYCDAAGNCDPQAFMINQAGNNVFFQPFPGYQGIGMKENSAVSNYNALQVNFRHAFGHGLTFQAAYTWSKTMDDSTSTYNSSPNGYNDYDLKRWMALSDLNRTQVLQLNYIYDVPLAKNASNRFVKGAFGGWQVSGITSFFTGQPENIGCGINGFSTGVNGSVRCNTVGKLKINKHTQIDPLYGPTLAWYDATSYTQPLDSQFLANNEPGMFGYMGRNTLSGPGRNNTDLALLKNFTLPWFKGEHSTLQFRWETFNTFNHTQYQFVDTGCDGSPNQDGSLAFGRPCNQFGQSNVAATLGQACTPNANDSTCTIYNGGRGEPTGVWAPRIMQVGMKLIF